MEWTRLTLDNRFLQTMGALYIPSLLFISVHYRKHILKIIQPLIHIH